MVLFTAMEEGLPLNRRGFLVRLVLAAQVLLALALTVPGIGYLLTPVFAARRQRGWVPLGAPAPPTASPPLRVEIATRELDGYVVRERKRIAWLVADPSSGGAIVFSGECTHLGCNFDWSPADSLFVCPCHGGRFDRSGRNVAGPPRRPLDRYPVKDEGGVLFVMPLKEKA